MNTRVLRLQNLIDFCSHLESEEKSAATIEKYLRDVRTFFSFAGEQTITKELVISYKKSLINKYAVRSINSMLASLNNFFTFMGYHECKVKSLRVQRQTYCKEEKELTKAEYLRLVDAARGQIQINLIMQTISGTGIRISELKYFTVESIQQGEVVVRCKSKTRVILIPGKLRKRLLDFAKKQGIKKGNVFITRTGKPLDRSNIWSKMKRLCESAGVKATKVFPHNLRKLFARTFYRIEKDIAKLADILGHGSIETTRIYIMTTGTEHRRKIESLGLVI